MGLITVDYGRDLDLNLLRVFVTVADLGSVTRAAERLYLTQPAISAALRRLAAAVGERLVARAGRGIALTTAGERLAAAARPHLAGLLAAAREPLGFDPRTTERTIHLGLSDAAEAWLLPDLLSTLARAAPAMRLAVHEVQFRTVGRALTSGEIELAVTVADELPADVERLALAHGRFVALFDPRFVSLGRRPSLERYLAEPHLVVSYNGDLRGIVEDLLGVERRVRVSLPSFRGVGPAVEGRALVATIPERLAVEIRRSRPRLAVAELPFTLPSSPIELLWRRARAADPALRFVLEQVRAVAARPRARRSPDPPVGRRRRIRRTSDA